MRLTSPRTSPEPSCARRADRRRWTAGAGSSRPKPLNQWAISHRSNSTACTPSPSSSSDQARRTPARRTSSARLAGRARRTAARNVKCSPSARTWTTADDRADDLEVALQRLVVNTRTSSRALSRGFGHRPRAGSVGPPTTGSGRPGRSGTVGGLLRPARRVSPPRAVEVPALPRPAAATSPCSATAGAARRTAHRPGRASGGRSAGGRRTSRCRRGALTMPAGAVCAHGPIVSRGARPAADERDVVLDHAGQEDVVPAADQARRGAVTATSAEWSRAAHHGSSAVVCASQSW